MARLSSVCGACHPQVLELPNKAEKVLSFAWEPKGHRFAIVHGDSGRPNVSFYSMRDEKGKLGIKHLGECKEGGRKKGVA
jgi:translation initiation factor 3 subunit B